MDYCVQQAQPHEAEVSFRRTPLLHNDDTCTHCIELPWWLREDLPRLVMEITISCFVVPACLLDFARGCMLHAMHCCCEASVPLERICSPDQVGKATHKAVVTQFLGFLC